MSTDAKTLAGITASANEGNGRLQALLAACQAPAHTTSLNRPGGLDGGADQVGQSFSVDVPGSICQLRHTAMAPPEDGQPVQLSHHLHGWQESIWSMQGHWTECRAPHVRMLTGRDARGNVWAVQFHRGGGQVESFVDHLGGMRALARTPPAAVHMKGICLDCLRAAAAAGSATVIRGEAPRH